MTTPTLTDADFDDLDAADILATLDLMREYWGLTNTEFANMLLAISFCPPDRDMPTKRDELIRNLVMGSQSNSARSLYILITHFTEEGE